ncbi:nitroreductase family protein [Diplocloster hominis]|uniref:nitroreductase family protein n=1 Tax=Diplocloster hominis TaxID=3079010 RepID=UPI0031BA9730
MNYFDLIERRMSIREFREKAVPAHILEEIQTHYVGCSGLIPDIRTSLRILEGEAIHKLKGIAGYQEFLIPAPYYLVLLSEPKEHYVENTGYIGEELDLKITELGLDSCWVTILNREAAKEALQISSGLEIAALIGFGYGKQEKKLLRLDIKTQSDINTNVRDGHVAPKINVSELVCKETWGRKFPVEELMNNDYLIRALYATSLAPSFLNLQPYRLILDGNHITLAVKKDGMTNANDEKLNIGIAMLHFTQVFLQGISWNFHWVMGSPDQELNLPGDWYAAAYCQV